MFFPHNCDCKNWTFEGKKQLLGKKLSHTKIVTLFSQIDCMNVSTYDYTDI